MVYYTCISTFPFGKAWEYAKPPLGERKQEGPMAITHIVFDIDGTLLDTEAAVNLALQETMEELLGHSLSLAELRSTFSMPARTALRVLGFPDIEAAYRHWSNKCRGYLGQFCLFDGIPHLLESLILRGYCLGIISSQTRAEFQITFASLELGDCFSTIILAEDTKEHKPHPEPMFCYLQRSGAKAQETLYIGDSVGDMSCAQEAGVRGALACWCLSPAEYPGVPRLERPGQLLDLLEELNAEAKTE
jgi:HAD superfamily hydrolase (TIGR01549 family)